MRNTNATIEESMDRVADIQSQTIKNNKKLVIYISMGFGNPYGDPWNVEIVERYVTQLYSMGIKIFSLSDTQMAVGDLMALSKVMEAAQWLKMTSLVICPQSKCFITSMKTR